MTDRRNRPRTGAAANANPFAKPAEPPPLPSRLITEREFCELYSAATFAAQWEMPLDVLVNITWPMLGAVDEAAVKEGWLSFRKCMTTWLSERALPQAWIYCHERGPTRGLHSHVAVFVPAKGWARNLRAEFRSWVLTWAKGFAGRRVPKSTRVRDDGGKRNLIYHWRHLSYICKGFDKSVVVLSGDATPDGLPRHLGDLIAWEWEDPGHVQMKRVGVSESLGPARRAKGYPEMASYYCEVPVLRDLDLSLSARCPKQQTSTRPITLFATNLPGSMASTICVPWRSAYENGVRHVEGLYPAEFIEVVEGGYPTAKELRARKLDAARAAIPVAFEEITEPGYPEDFSLSSW